jgi:serine/threonine-protein kinase
VESVDDPNVAKGKVIETSPKADSTVPAGSLVTLKVASGKVKVPTVEGLDLSDAQQQLSDAKLKYKSTFTFSDKPEGTVLAQTQRGETVDVGTLIDLKVAQVAPPTTPPTTATPTTTTPTTTPPAATTTP